VKWFGGHLGSMTAIELAGSTDELAKSKYCADSYAL
jgi:hypothetical protein